ncbi:MAG: SurA N-terminal domain-containing protein [Gammaproteobacteria bacterium]
MFESIRNHKKYLMGILLILIIPSFVLFGIEGYTRFNEQTEPVATVDGHDITKAEWEQAHQAEVQRRQQEMPGVDVKLFDTEQARYATLEQLVRDRVVAQAVDKLHLYTSDQKLARELQRNEMIASLRRPDGTLDVDAYRQLVGAQGMTPEMFEAQVRSDLSRQQLVAGLAGTAFSPKAVADRALNAFFERRDVRVRQFLASDFVNKVNPTDADIEAFYNANAAMFQAPEQVDVEYLVLDAAAIAKDVTLNEADLRKYYDENAARLAGPEERRASHILLTFEAGASQADKDAVKARAQTLLDQVRQNPSGFADLARAESQDPGSASRGGDLDFFGRGAMVKPFEDAVFAMKKGDISDLVESEFGYHIIQLTDVRAPEAKSFDELKASLEADLKKQQAQKLFSEKAEAFSNMVYEQSDSLKPAADEFKLELRTAKGLTRQPDPQLGALANPRVIEALFSADSVDKKRNTEALELGNSQLLSARVLSHQPARTLPLAEVHADVRARLVAQRAGELAREEGARQLEALRQAGDDKSMGTVQTVSRDKDAALPPAVLDAALSADPRQLPAWVGVALGGQGYAVVKVEKVLEREARDPQVMADEMRQYNQWWAAAEAQAYYDWLKQRFKVKMLVPAPK